MAVDQRRNTESGTFRGLLWLRGVEDSDSGSGLCEIKTLPHVECLVNHVRKLDSIYTTVGDDFQQITHFR